ncbi:hypothetical protein GCM10007108_06030 [Thermogymnomonas acidicola]|uniref:Holliday junction resolvase n=1 Tax=Thermogymnomonas acidicola TaxID=399579 RepID=A0AA37BQU2_9ARCH|nr:hypothetical protein [Thermogymnomonas acidicola]GGM70783.1 hypothetical protein GCM10007108_06030 [Thermogymnomonas acidicola]
MNGSVYERELASILSGDPGSVERYSRRVAQDTQQAVTGLIQRPFYVVRAAGSLGADLVAVRDDYTLIIEVKSSASRRLSFSEASYKRQEQAERLVERCSRAGLFLTYAFRLKNAREDPWRLFSLGSVRPGRMALLKALIPEVEQTRSGNYHLVWEHGVPLSVVIDYVNHGTV